ncbi:MAG: metal ABC transporter permease [Candidatus Hydrogenedentota bacterium]
MHTLWILIIGSLVGVSCALVGCFLVLRRLAMLGDAISHAVLPGIVIAFMLTASRNTLPMLAGAGAFGVLTAWLTDVLMRRGQLQSDAAIGVTFTWLFAVGVILVSAFTGHVDLDVDCVLHGEILFVPFDTWTVGGVDIGPRAFWILAGVTLANLVFIGLGYKELKLCAFDAALAAAMGFNVVLWHYLLMGLVALTTVAAFESVGAILVVAMLIVPANAAYLLTDRLSVMLLLASLFGVLSAVGGYGLATLIDGSIAAAMAVFSGLIFLAAALLSPTHGALGYYLARRAQSVSSPDIAARETPGR